MAAPKVTVTLSPAQAATLVKALKTVPKSSKTLDVIASKLDEAVAALPVAE